MPELRWTTVASPRAGSRAVVMASRLVVRSPADLPRFLRASLAARRQARTAPGALGLSIAVQPLRRTFWTVSAWESREALRGYAAAEPHRGIMAALRPAAAESVFTLWEVPAEELPIPWDEARQRLARAAPRP
ncbi:putative quinol monooxygenase [Kitasatospora sp. NPDC059571]|uniref:putative quinol monooxygenase n=1 Tax=Kitasatospora sp. NPDC059571 TaxID=3346871 RepID=UPI0036CBCA8E